MAVGINAAHEIRWSRESYAHDAGSHEVRISLKIIFNFARGIEPAILRTERVRT